MLQMKIQTGRRTVVPGDLPSILGAKRAYVELGDMVEALIAQMDMLAGDCDVEANGDELDGSLGEDDFCDHNVSWLALPGCPVSDPGGCDEISPYAPVYRADQTRGPINVGLATQAHDLHQYIESYRNSGDKLKVNKLRRRLKEVEQCPISRAF